MTAGCEILEFAADLNGKCVASFAQRPLGLG